MTSRQYILVAVFAGVLGLAPTFASEPAVQDGASSPQAPDAGRRDARRHLTAEDVLKELQRRRPPNLMIAPIGGYRTDQPTLLPEGYPVIGRTGTLIRDADGARFWKLVLDDRSSAKNATLPPSIRLLPNAALEPMSRTAGSADTPVRFQVSGETTVFDGENYLLTRFASTADDESATGIRRGSPGAAKSQDDKIAGETTKPTVSADAGVDDVLKQLLEQTPTQEPVSMSANSPATNVQGTDSAMGGLIPEGTSIIDRPGRVVQHGEWWTFVFESDHPDLPEPPMKLLPNRGLELMLESVRNRPGGVVFLLSGQVQVFERENYLLAQAVRRRASSDNLRK